MKKEQVTKILIRSSVALIIPLLGELFVQGWNWGISDFIFAWVFFNLLGFSYTFAVHKAPTRGAKIVLGVLVVAVFAFIWIRLATG